MKVRLRTIPFANKFRKLAGTKGNVAVAYYKVETSVMIQKKKQLLKAVHFSQGNKPLFVENLVLVKWLRQFLMFPFLKPFKLFQLTSKNKLAH